jgi:hypothetical protein
MGPAALGRRVTWLTSRPGWSSSGRGGWNQTGSLQSGQGSGSNNILTTSTHRFVFVSLLYICSMFLHIWFENLTMFQLLVGIWIAMSLILICSLYIYRLLFLYVLKLALMCRWIWHKAKSDEKGDVSFRICWSKQTPIMHGVPFSGSTQQNCFKVSSWNIQPKQDITTFHYIHLLIKRWYRTSKERCTTCHCQNLSQKYAQTLMPFFPKYYYTSNFHQKEGKENSHTNSFFLKETPYQFVGFLDQ